MKPMLAATLKDVTKVKFPVIASPKLDGIRTLIHPTLGPVTRSLKPLPNVHIRDYLSDPVFHNLDGEVVVGNLGAADAFNSTQSAVMRSSGVPIFTFIVFDSFENPDDEYTVRQETAHAQIDKATAAGLTNVKLIESRLITSILDLDEYQYEQLDLGYEGAMIRQPNGEYKWGRSTENAGTLVKLKQFADAEAKIVEVEYLKHNLNASTRNALGRTERSSHAAGKVEDVNQIGALVVEAINGDFEGVRFKIGTGFTAKMREDFAWKHDLIGSIVNFAYQSEGSKDAPRFPRFRGFRSEDDM